MRSKSFQPSSTESRVNIAQFDNAFPDLEGLDAEIGQTLCTSTSVQTRPNTGSAACRCGTIGMLLRFEESSGGGAQPTQELHDGYKCSF